MNFLEAQRTLAAFNGGDSLPFMVAMSGTTAPLDLYLRAAAAQRGRTASPSVLPYNTLAQALREAPNETFEVFLLLPWDFVPEADWRSGIPEKVPSAARLIEHAELTGTLLAGRPRASVFYLPAPIVPLFANPADTAALESRITSLAAGLGAVLLSPDAFSLGSYLSTGCPITGGWLGNVAEAIVARVLAPAHEACKVLITDLDNVLWDGVIAEDGLSGISFGPEGIGYRHFLYQSLLLKLKREGTLLAAVSRNDRVSALEPLRGGRMLLGERDFVCVLASYHPKSAQIRLIAERLNLGLDAFVFVDDNLVELAEVSAQLPQVRSLRFPSRDNDLPDLFQNITHLFAKAVVTAEDRERTELYRRRLAGMPPAESNGADLTAFLRGLGMTLHFHDRRQGDRTRTVQLLNKTNQFNLNGRRMTVEEIAETLDRGGRLYGATLTDRTGSHGEILAALISADGVMRSLVLSCRVFQRRVEYAFLAWLAARDSDVHSLDFAPTPRNEPIRQFLHDPAFSFDNGVVRFDRAKFTESHAGDLALFNITGPQSD